jgi:uncharacterized protein YceK
VRGGKLSNTKNKKIKFNVALDGCATIFHATTNQKSAAYWSWYMRAGATRGEHAWGMTTLF